MSDDFRRERTKNNFLHLCGPHPPPPRQREPIFVFNIYNQGLLAGLLSAPYVVQRLGDFDPGLEFKTAMAYADASIRPQPAGAVADEVSSKCTQGGATLSGTGTAAAAATGRWEGGAGPGEECAIVLGDRDVQETLRRLGGALTALTGRRGDGEEKAGQHGSGGGAVGVLGTAGRDLGEIDLKVCRWERGDNYLSIIAGGVG